MKLNIYGIELARLEKKDIELVRQWRNDQSIARNMFYRNYITAEQQQTWFNSINNNKHYYFLVSYKRNPIGLAHVSNINYNKQWAEVGLFIYNQALQGTEIPVLSSLSLLYVAFEILKLKGLIAKVLPHNQKAKQYNSALGFNTSSSCIMELTNAVYFNKTKLISSKVKPARNKYIFIP